MGGQGKGVGEEAQANGERRSRGFDLIGQQISEQAHWERVGSKLI